MTEPKHLTLQDGTRFPAFGLGTWKSAPGEVYDAVRWALEAGYRHVDCAAIYGNEAEVGQAFQDAFEAGDCKREELWVTSKLWNDCHRKEHVRPALEKTLADLRLDYLDLYLIHWPIAFRHGVSFPESPGEFLTLEEAPLEQTWEAMAACKDAGLTRQIGVSNMGPSRIEALSQVGPTPAVNQVECHPHLQQRDLLDFCASRNIAVTAYSPLGSTDRAQRKDDEPPLLDHPTLVDIATDTGATVAQVLIAWALHRGTAVIPKSVDKRRIEENLQALSVELSPAHLDAIAALDKGYRYLDGEFFARNGSPYQAAEIWL